MGRWEPNTRERLARAALELFGERGYEQTTVAEIARRAGLTERTYFRHYADKREVLFGGSDVLRKVFATAVAEAPASDAPIDVVAAGLEAVAAVFPGRETARQRQSVVGSHPELQERELIKLATLSAAVTEALHARGVADPTAALAAEAGIAVFKIGYERWIAPAEHRELADLLHASLTELKAVTAGSR
ncbi:TetR/AcrR family transcriptional regulator [Streptomyces griseoruber]|uniref:TetR family transcriptional regulator n=1 Tax=Streptomyces griseoruber TaxID=1943 RepID=A0A117REG0_9ACTN|nr:TetR/AcrR family transcriptional regulator [Streptomyces griseoruber]KUN86294.1 TetR family transcriptional regulator [Streptomyces griseoruber]